MPCGILNASLGEGVPVAADRRALAAAGLITVTDAGIAATAAVVELQYPGAGVALAATIPFLTRAQEWAWTRFLKLAEERSGLTGEEIVTRLGQLDEGVRLLSRTVNALRVAPYEEKLRILASSISIAAHDHTLINEELLVVAAIEALEPYHLRLLHAGEKAARIGHRGPSDRDYAADRVHIEDAGLTPDIVEMLSGALVSLGLITTTVATNAPVDSPLYSVTRLGQLVLERARTEEE